MLGLRVMRALIFLLSVVVLVGCATGDRVRALEPGMSMDQVIERLGRPDGYSSVGSVEVLRYANAPMGWNSPARADYVITLQEGRVVGYGAQHVWQPQASTLLVAGAVDLQ